MNATGLSACGGAEEPYMLSADYAGELGKSLSFWTHFCRLAGFVSSASLWAS